MNAKIQLLAALTGVCLTSGCVVPYAYQDTVYGGPVEYGAPVGVAALPPNEIFVPQVVIVENGIRHDRYFYQRHPEFYHRDRLRYPDRFRHLPPPPPYHRDYGFHRGPVVPPPAAYGRPGGYPGDHRQGPPQDPRAKKKKHSHDRDRDHDDNRR